MYLMLKFLSQLPLSVLYFLARALGLAMMLMPNATMRRVIRVNLNLAYPNLSNKQRENLEQASVYSQFFTAVESIKSWGMPSSYSLKQIHRVYDAAILTNALKNPNGVIAVVPHFGTWEVMNAWLNQYASPVIMYKPSKNIAVDRFMLEARQRLNAMLVPTDESGVRAIFRALKQGGVTAILPDHVPDHSGGIYSEFMGQRVLTTTLVSKLAQKTQCSVVGLSCIRRNDGLGFDIVCDLLDSEILSKDLSRSVDYLNKEITRMIARAPEQYMWGYKRFKQLENQQQVYRNSI